MENREERRINKALKTNYLVYNITVANHGLDILSRDLDSSLTQSFLPHGKRFLDLFILYNTVEGLRSRQEESGGLFCPPE